MASRRWFEAQVEQFTKSVGGKAKVTSDSPTDHSAMVTYKEEVPTLNTVESAARTLSLRIERTEDGDVLSPR